VRLWQVLALKQLARDAGSLQSHQKEDALEHGAARQMPGGGGLTGNETAGAKAVRGHVESANPLQRDEKDNDDDQALGAQAGKRRAPRVS